MTFGLGAAGAAAQPWPGGGASGWEDPRWSDDGADTTARPGADSDAATGWGEQRGALEGGERARPPQDLRLLEAEVLDEMNRMRRDPRAYAGKLRQLRTHFDGTVLRVPGKPAVLTEEGGSAVDEAIAVLERTGARPLLSWSDGLAAAARDHASDLAVSGRLGHAGSDGSQPDDRASRHGRWHELVAENITFGSMTAEEVVVDLLIDDGVADRGHRDVLLDRGLHVAGVACGTHPSYRRTCVIDYATAFDDARGTPRTQPPTARAPEIRDAPSPAPRVEVRPVPRRQVPPQRRQPPTTPDLEPIIEV
jgi:uncharacterized protein YkwD